MTWLLLAILAYFFLAVVSLFDRYFLVGPTPNPKVYTFNIGLLLLIAALFFLPFGVKFSSFGLILLGLLAGILRILGILFQAKAIFSGEVSRVTPLIWGILPIFSFFLFFFFQPASESFDLSHAAAFIAILVGSVLISVERPGGKVVNYKNFLLGVVSALFFALSFFLTKNLFLRVDFVNGFFLILLGGGLAALAFLFFSSVRREIFGQKINSKISAVFILGQAAGGLGVLLQFYAVWLAKPIQVPIINALEGVKYGFLLVFILILSGLNPNLLREKTGGPILAQKVAAILAIGVGLAALSFLR